MIDDPQEGSRSKSGTYVVSMGKFSLLFLATFGLYAHYWFYRNWTREPLAASEKFLAILISVFYPFFVVLLFRKIATEEQRVNQSYAWSPALLSGLFLGIFLISLWSNTQTMQHGPSLGLSLLGYLILFVHYYILYKVQLVINRIGGDPFGKSNSKVSSENSLWIILGFTLWLMQLSGLYSLATSQDPDLPDLETQQAILQKKR